MFFKVLTNNKACVETEAVAQNGSAAQSIAVEPLKDSFSKDFF